MGAAVRLYGVFSIGILLAIPAFPCAKWAQQITEPSKPSIAFMDQFHVTETTWEKIKANPNFTRRAMAISSAHEFSLKVENDLYDRIGNVLSNPDTSRKAPWLVRVLHWVAMGRALGDFRSTLFMTAIEMSPAAIELSTDGKRVLVNALDRFPKSENMGTKEMDRMMDERMESFAKMHFNKSRKTVEEIVLNQAKKFKASKEVPSKVLRAQIRKQITYEALLE